MITLKDFLYLDKYEKMVIFKWRNDPLISSFMKNKHITIREHLRFLNGLKYSTDKKYFLVYDDEVPIGVIDFVDIQFGDKCEFGVYQNPTLRGYGKILMKLLIEYAFNELKVKTLEANVYSNNYKALKLYSEFGFIKKQNSERDMDTLVLLIDNYDSKL